MDTNDPAVQAALDNLMTFGFTPISPPIFGALVTLGVLHNSQPVTRCGVCGAVLTGQALDSGECPECVWWEGLRGDIYEQR